MILALSTSGPIVGVAWFDETGQVIYRGVQESRRNASGAIGDLLERSGHPVAAATSLLCDIGPGSFTGVRVGVTMAKVIAAQLNVPIFAMSAFDLFDLGSVAIPSKPGKFYVRHEDEMRSGISEREVLELGCRVIAPADWDNIFATMPAESALRTTTAEELEPLYVAEPGISTAKQPHIMGETAGGTA